MADSLSTDDVSQMVNYAMASAKAQASDTQTKIAISKQMDAQDAITKDALGANDSLLAANSVITGTLSGFQQQTTARKAGADLAL